MAKRMDETIKENIEELAKLRGTILELKTVNEQQCVKLAGMELKNTHLMQTNETMRLQLEVARKELAANAAAKVKAEEPKALPANGHAPKDA